MSSVPARILFLHPDTYGDLVLFEPVLRLVREEWPQTEIGVLVRAPYVDAAPLLAEQGAVRWLTTTCNPYRQSPRESRAGLEELRAAVLAFNPDWLVAACLERTWLDAAVASFLPHTRKFCMGEGDLPALEAEFGIDWATVRWEEIPVETASREWEKNLLLAGTLLGKEAPRWWPIVRTQQADRQRADEVLSGAGLSRGAFAAVCAAGTANVRIKAWPAERFAENIAWLERVRGLKTLLIGHESERTILETVRDGAAAAGASPAIWLGQDGEIGLLAALLEAAQFYLGNDTGAVHLAAGLGRPLVAIYGGGTWPRFEPVARRSVVIVQPLPCFGCRWDCFFVDAPCIRTISTDSVRQALERFLADDRDGQTVFEGSGLGADARGLIEVATPKLRFLRDDSLARHGQVQQLTHQVSALSRRLEASDADRDARLDEIETLSRRLEASDTDREARLGEIETLSRRLEASDADRDARLREIRALATQLAVSESDRDARLVKIDEFGRRIKEMEAEHTRQIDQLKALLEASDTDREARLRQVGVLDRRLLTADADFTRQLNELRALLAASEADRDARLKQVERLTPLLLESEADRAARGELLKTLGSQIQRMDASLQEQDKHIRMLTGQLTLPSASGTPEPDTGGNESSS